MGHNGKILLKSRPSDNAESPPGDHILERFDAETGPQAAGSQGVTDARPIVAEARSEFASFLRDAAAGSGRGTVTIIPAEQVSLLTVALPVRGARARRAALPFAVEDRISAPLEDVHIALCRQIAGSDRILAAVIDRRVMGAIDTRSGPIMPETLALATPDAGEGAPCWAVWTRQSRALVRVSDGTGFAVAPAMLALLWKQAGQPKVHAYGDPLPEGMSALTSVPSPPQVDDRDLAVDLRQGSFAKPSTDWSRYALRVAVLAGIAMVGHLGLRIADTVALTRIADRERAVAQAAVDPVLPGVQVTPQIDPILRRLAPVAEVASGGDFLPLLSTVSLALLNGDGSIGFRRLSFADNPPRLTLLLEAPDLEGLQQAEHLLRAEGFTVTTGAALAAAGVAETDFVISQGGS